MRLDASGWAEILARPRSFVSGDPLPAEICEALGTAKILVLSLLLPQFVPDGIPPGIPGPITWVLFCACMHAYIHAYVHTCIQVGAATGAAMATKPGKRLLMRLAADNLKSRHVLVNDEATDEQLFRFEINMVHDQWLPVAVFRPAEVEVDETERVFFPHQFGVMPAPIPKFLKMRLVGAFPTRSPRIRRSPSQPLGVRRRHAPRCRNDALAVGFASCRR